MWRDSPEFVTAAGNAGTSPIDKNLNRQVVLWLFLSDRPRRDNHEFNELRILVLRQSKNG